MSEIYPKESWELMLNRERIERQQAEVRAKLRGEGVDVSALEAWMKEYDVYDYEKAAKAFRSINTQAAPTPASLTPMTLPDTKGLWKDSKGWADKEAHAAMNEVIANRGKQARTA